MEMNLTFLTSNLGHVIDDVPCRESEIKCTTSTTLFRSWITKIAKTSLSKYPIKERRPRINRDSLQSQLSVSALDLLFRSVTRQTKNFVRVSSAGIRARHYGSSILTPCIRHLVTLTCSSPSLVPPELFSPVWITTYYSNHALLWPGSWDEKFSLKHPSWKCSTLPRNPARLSQTPAISSKAKKADKTFKNQSNQAPASLNCSRSPQITTTWTENQTNLKTPNLHRNSLHRKTLLTLYTNTTSLQKLVNTDRSSSSSQIIGLKQIRNRK